MQTIKFTLIFACLFFYLVLGILVRLVLMRADPFTVIKVMNRLKFFLMHSFRIICNLKIKISGRKDLLKERGLFIISTHVGYLDGVILGTLVPGSFTTKQEIKDIPFLGRVVSIGGSIFIDRKEKNQIFSYVNQMAKSKS